MHRWITQIGTNYALFYQILVDLEWAQGVAAWATLFRPLELTQYFYFPM